MATLGVALSTLVFDIGAHLMFGLPLLVALVFGSLISPTYPVAVLGVLRAANLKKSLETKTDLNWPKVGVKQRAQILQAISNELESNPYQLIYYFYIKDYLMQ